MIDSQSLAIKDQARQIVEGLPADATWDDLMERIYVRQAIEAGLAAATENRTVDVAEVRKSFGLTE